jgi:hypothetical protein
MDHRIISALHRSSVRDSDESIVLAIPTFPSFTCVHDSGESIGIAMLVHSSVPDSDEFINPTGHPSARPFICL